MPSASSWSFLEVILLFQTSVIKCSILHFLFYIFRTTFSLSNATIFMAKYASVLFYFGFLAPVEFHLKLYSDASTLPQNLTSGRYLYSTIHHMFNLSILHAQCSQIWLTYNPANELINFSVFFVIAKVGVGTSISGIVWMLTLWTNIILLGVLPFSGASLAVGGANCWLLFQYLGHVPPPYDGSYQ